MVPKAPGWQNRLSQSAPAAATWGQSGRQPLALQGLLLPESYLENAGPTLGVGALGQWALGQGVWAEGPSMNLQGGMWSCQ